MIADLFEKRIINRYSTIDRRTNKVVLYRRHDLYEWAKEAYAKGEPYFYCRPVNPEDPYGELELCEPEYRWFIKNNDGLTEEEFKQLISAKDTLQNDDEYR